MHINSIWRFSIGFHIPTQYTLVPDNYGSEDFIEWFIKVKYSVIPFQQSVRRHWIFPNSRVHDIKDIDADVITQTWLNGKALSLSCEHDSLSYTYDKTLKTQTYTFDTFRLAAEYLAMAVPYLYGCPAFVQMTVGVLQPRKRYSSFPLFYEKSSFSQRDKSSFFLFFHKLSVGCQVAA